MLVLVLLGITLCFICAFGVGAVAFLEVAFNGPLSGEQRVQHSRGQDTFMIDHCVAVEPVQHGLSETSSDTVRAVA